MYKCAMCSVAQKWLREKTQRHGVPYISYKGERFCARRCNELKINQGMDLEPIQCNYLYMGGARCTDAEFC